MRNNSVIFKNPEDQHLLDLSSLGTMMSESKEIRLEQENHCFQVGDALFYDIINHRFDKAQAINSIDSEVCGIVSEVVDLDTFIIITEGKLITDRYKYAAGSALYLSEVVPGFLMSAAPTSVVKQVAVQLTDGIQVDIQMGWYLSEQPVEVSLEPYTKEELDDIILNVKG